MLPQRNQRFVGTLQICNLKVTNSVGWGWRRDGVMLQLHCFGDVTVYVIPENGKSSN